MAGIIRAVKVGNREITFEANGATFVLYQQAFKRDGLRAVMNLEEEPMDSLALCQEFAYIMSGAYEKGVPYIKWLSSFGVMDLPNACEDIMDVLTDSMETSEDEEGETAPKNAEAGAVE